MVGSRCAINSRGRRRSSQVFSLDCPGNGVNSGLNGAGANAGSGDANGEHGYRLEGLSGPLLIDLNRLCNASGSGSNNDGNASGTGSGNTAVQSIAGSVDNVVSTAGDTVSNLAEGLEDTAFEMSKDLQDTAVELLRPSGQ